MTRSMPARDIDPARPSNQSSRVIGRHEDTLETTPSKDEGEDS